MISYALSNLFNLFAFVQFLFLKPIFHNHELFKDFYFCNLSLIAKTVVEPFRFLLEASQSLLLRLEISKIFLGLTESENN